MGKAWRWTKRRMQWRTLLQGTDATRATVKAWAGNMLREVGKEGGWQPSEVAMATASKFRQIDEVADRLGMEQ